MDNAQLHKNKATELELIVDSWERRHEWRLLSKTAPRSLIIALLLSLVVGAVGYFRFGLAAEQLALISGGLCAVGGVLNLLYTLLFPRSLPVRAQYFDLQFGLQERVSTAFELMHGRIRTHPEIEAKQIADALDHARAIDPKSQITMDFRSRELAALFFLAIAMVVMVLLPTIVGDDFITDGPSAAVEAAEEDLREIIETVAKDTDLADIDRQELLDALEIALERLQEEDISEEEAFAAMSQLQSQLEELENRLQDTVELDQSALEAALEALEDFIPPSETDDSGSDASSGMQEPPDNLQELSQALDQLAQDAAEMSAEESQAAAEALELAAEELQEANSDLSEQLQSMSEALQENERAALQDALEQAQQELSQQQQQEQQNQNAQAMLQEQAEQAEEAAEAIAKQQAQEGQADQSESGEQRGGQPANQSGRRCAAGHESRQSRRPAKSTGLQ